MQRQTLRYFWEFGHPVSGLARERITIGRDPDDRVATGASGMGAMAIITGVERGWIRRQDAVKRLLTMTRFLENVPCYHGIFPHWMNGRTGATIPFARKDDGGDLVETAFLFQGLLCARQYFHREDSDERELRRLIDRLWCEAEWDWHTRGGLKMLYWHWSPNHGWSMDFEIRGWNECLIAYVLAASAPHYAIDASVYHGGWVQGQDFRNERTYHDIELPLGPDYGGPLYFAHYSFLGLDPRGLKDRYANYWRQNVHHVRINREYCIHNPHHFKGYGPDCWGLTSDDTDEGYRGLHPKNDLGFIAPNAALASFPYTPAASMLALQHFDGPLRERLWGECGFTSSFSESKDWYSRDYIGVDQGPTLVMIENYRSGLLWKLFMSCPEIRSGLAKLGFESPHLA
ncbi:glucoamylase family protein [Microvirga sp. 2TAF3]|uniref:glucoamylase family protein n=1 Tax=Microvirga sp. 2TAF3 TaxID=3233014 RepID=UPI003F9764D5